MNKVTQSSLNSSLFQTSSPWLHPPESSWELGVQELLEHLPRALTAVQGRPGLAWAAAAKEIQGFPSNHHCLSCFFCSKISSTESLDCSSLQLALPERSVDAPSEEIPAGIAVFADLPGGFLLANSS